MKVTTIEFEFGLTQNVGDYSNVRPSVKMTAELDEGDTPWASLAELSDLVIDRIHCRTDDELELNGHQVKYYAGPLYQVQHSKVRGCVVIVPAGTELPQEQNWKERDSWSSHIYEGNFPSNMRLGTAQRAANLLAQNRDYLLIPCPDGDLIGLPPLPDPGPEPLWHQKGLERYLNSLRIDHDAWEELATLDHVNEDYLREVYSKIYHSTPNDEVLAFIRENRPFEPEPVEEDEDDYDDEDWDDDDF